ncbi:hypothetical protein MPNT_20074 [Candidatus Methylacidithermus pantelleriae]|uniref:Uncharacterized protein n=1 Tax=Candidatus Methylacidithermus pantelleriae TaxID=2744239 RepID=A0A8J2BHV0_9BACT|nr:hypothetical protein MPNT_20074 [Candidatus Methylacidithermus pantelleriae]
MCFSAREKTLRHFFLIMHPLYGATETTSGGKESYPQLCGEFNGTKCRSLRARPSLPSRWSS